MELTELNELVSILPQDQKKKICQKLYEKILNAIECLDVESMVETLVQNYIDDFESGMDELDRTDIMDKVEELILDHVNHLKLVAKDTDSTSE
jgi:hypothetical protein